MKKIFTTILLTLGFILPTVVSAQVFTQRQLILPPFSGMIMSTTTANGGFLQASTSPTLNSITATSTTLVNYFGGPVKIVGNLSLPSLTDGCVNLTGGIIGTTGSACGSGSGSTFPFTPTSYGVSTSTTIGLLNGFLSTASSTINSTFHLPTLSDGCLTVTSGLVTSVGSPCGSGTGSPYPFPLTGNATSTLTQFNGGITAYATSTIGNGNLGLTINGAATTTGQAVFSDGSFSLPGIAFIKARNSGLFDSAGAVSVISGGTDYADFGSGSVVLDQAPVLATITGSTQCLQVDTSGILSGTGSPCGSGGSQNLFQTLTNGNNAGGLAITDAGAITGTVLSATSTTATSTITNALQIGTTAENAMLAVVPLQNFPGSISTQGAVDIINTSNSGAGLIDYTNHGSGATARLGLFNVDNTAFDQNALYVRSQSLTTTAMNVEGAPNGQGLFKLDIGSGGNTGTNNTALLSIDATDHTSYVQGATIKCNSATSTSCLALRNASSATLFKVDGNGNATTSGITEVDGTGTSTFTGGLSSSIFNATSASASSTFADGINLTSGCYAINGTCLSTGGGGSGTVTNIATTWPITGGPITTTGTLGFNGLSTTSPWTNGQIAEVTSGNQISSVATGTISTLGGITVTGSPYIIGANTTLSCLVSSASNAGCLSSTDWSTFNGKQAAGNYITALTGDVTASGPNSVAATLATVNSNVGTFTNATLTVNGKGLITAASNGTAGSASSTLLGDNNTFSGLNNFTKNLTFAYSSSTAYSSFQTSSSTLGYFGTLNLPNLANPAGKFLAVDPSGNVIATTTPSGTGSNAVSIPVQYATTGALPANTYLSGVLTEVGTGTLSVDGNSPIVGNRILVKNEVAQTNNGIYSVTATGSGIAAYVLTRVSDYNSSSNVIPGEATYVINGATLADDWWALTTSAPITVGGGGSGSNLTYVETNATAGGVTSIIAGTGLTGGTITTTGTIALSTPVVIANGGTATTTGGYTNGVEYFNGSTLTNSSIFNFNGTNVGIGSTTPSETLVVNGGILGTENKVATSTSINVDFSASNQTLIQNGGAGLTVTIKNFMSGQAERVVVCNPASTAGTVTWATSPANKLLWPAGTAPTQTTTANKCDVYTFTVTQASSTVVGSAEILGGYVQNF